jgi:Heterokaryon incompatibility protein Het-C
MRLHSPRALAVAVLVTMVSGALAADAAKPAASAAAASKTAAGKAPLPPAPVVPSLSMAKPPIMCIDCDQPFDTTTHKDVLEGLTSNLFIGELRKALYLQDTYHQFESKAHFDNCDFDDAIAYISELYAEAGRYADEAVKAKTARNADAMQKAALNAFFALGQTLHGVQDFYAHTNYIELQVGGVKAVTDIPLVLPWRSEGKARIAELRKDGLISGFVFWGFPQRCPSGTISHGKLAKDAATTSSGKVAIAHLKNVNQYKIAVFLARETSLRLVTDAFKKWPLLKELNGELVALDVLVDRRDADAQ